MSTMTTSWYSSAVCCMTLVSPSYANGDQRFEVDGADAAARFLREHGVPEARVTTVWQAIALHTSAGLAHRFGAEQAITHFGIGADIVGADKHMLPSGFPIGCMRRGRATTSAMRWPNSLQHKWRPIRRRGLPSPFPATYINS